MNRQEIYDALQGIELNPNKRAQLANLFFNMSSKDTNDNSIMYYLCICSSTKIEDHLAIGIGIGEVDTYYTYVKFNSTISRKLDAYGVNNLTNTIFRFNNLEEKYKKIVESDLLAVHFLTDIDPAIRANTEYLVFPCIKLMEDEDGRFMKFCPVNGVVGNRLIHGVYLDSAYNISVITSIYNSNNK